MGGEAGASERALSLKYRIPNPNPTSDQPTNPYMTQIPPQPDARAQWLDSRMTVRGELKYDSRSNGREQHVVIEDPVRSKFFQIGVAEYRLIALLNGTRTVAEAAKLASDPNLPGVEGELGEHADDGKHADFGIRVAQWLIQNNLAFVAGLDNSKRLKEQARQTQRAKTMGWLNPISCKIKLFNPNRLLTMLEPFVGWMFSGWVLAIWLTFATYTLTILYSEWGRIGDATNGIFSGSSWLWMLLIWLVLKVLHEMAHGIACRRFGGEVPEAGVLFLLFTPMAYVNVTSMWRFGNRWQRIIVAAAGMYVELFLSFIGLIIWQKYPGVAGDIGFKTFMMASVTTILFNANPLMRFDGYFILSDLLNIPNLYTKGTKWFGDRFKHWFFGTPKTPNLYAAGERRIVQVYGVLAWFWKSTISISLIIGASALFQGAGLVLAAIGAVLWYGLPVWQQFKWLRSMQINGGLNRQRTIISCVLTAMLLVGMFSVLKAPATKSAPAIVQFSHEQLLRASADGFVKEILVDNGQSVVANDALLVLANPELELELFELERLAEEANTEVRIHSQTGELALAQAAKEKHDGLMKQVTEKREQVDQLTVRAAFAGIVFGRGLGNRINSFVHAGDPLLTLAQSDAKEVVVTIDQRDLESVRHQQGKFMRVAFPGQPLLKSKLTHLNPRASTQLQHPSLGANCGGALPVKPVTSENSTGDSHFELLTPMFNAKLELAAETSDRLFAGQRGRVFFASDRQSLGSYLYLALSDWFQKKVELATQANGI